MPRCGPKATLLFDVMKNCSKCKSTLSIDNFCKNKSRKDGLDGQCKICKKTYKRNKVQAAEYYQRTKHNKTKSPERKEEIRQYKKLRYQSNKEFFKKQTRDNYNKNKNTINSNRRVENMNPIDVLKKNEIIRNRRNKNDLTKLVSIVRCRTNAIIKYKGVKKDLKSLEYLGCSIEHFKKHLEKQFSKGMTWYNHGRGEGKWHIDHKIPASIIKNIDDLKQVCHYTNLQPLWGVDNLKKNAKIIPHQIHLAL